MKTLDVLLKEYEQSIYETVASGGIAPRWVIKNRVEATLHAVCDRGYNFDITVSSSLNGIGVIRIGNPENCRIITIEISFYDTVFMAQSTSGSKHKLRDLESALAWVLGETEATEPEKESVDSILLEAQELVFGERAEQYGDPSKSFEYIAKMWSTVLKTEVEAYQVAQCMIGLKLARASASPVLRDSWVDIAGYACLGEMVVPKVVEE